MPCLGSLRARRALLGFVYNIDIPIMVSGNKEERIQPEEWFCGSRACTFILRNSDVERTMCLGFVISISTCGLI